MMSVTFSYCCPECDYAECRFAECHYTECHRAESRGTRRYRVLPMHHDIICLI